MIFCAVNGVIEADVEISGVGEKLSHFFRGLEIVPFAVEAHAVGVGQAALGADAQQHVVTGRILLAEIVTVIGAYQRQSRFVVHPQKSLVDDGLITDAVIGLAGKIHMEVLAEGVETEQQVEFLSGMGCDLAQGYYYAAPMTGARFEERL